MNILFLHLSDLHISEKEDCDNMKIKKLVKALNIFSSFDECIIIISGDIVKSGQLKQFKIAKRFIGELIVLIKKGY